jgi:hypothetical protein
MAKCHDLQVDILIDEEPQRIYNDPDPGDNIKPKEIVHYVEAITDAKFAIKITLEPQFDLLDSDGCRIIVELDGSKCYYYVPKKDIVKAHQVHSRGYTEIYSTRLFYDSVAQQRKRGALCFGSLKVCK